MGLVVGLYSVIGGVVLGLLLAAVFASRSESIGSGLVNFLGAAYFTVPASTIAVFLVAFWFIAGRPPIDIFKSGPDVPPASS